jgi:hypothetical protein
MRWGRKRRRKLVADRNPEGESIISFCLELFCLACRVWSSR